MIHNVQRLCFYPSECCKDGIYRMHLWQIVREHEMLTALGWCVIYHNVETGELVWPRAY